MARLMQSRRGFITGLAALIAAPAIVKAESLMPIKVVRHTIEPIYWASGDQNLYAILHPHVLHDIQIAHNDYMNDLLNQIGTGLMPNGGCLITEIGEYQGIRIIEREPPKLGTT